MALSFRLWGDPELRVLPASAEPADGLRRLRRDGRPPDRLDDRRARAPLAGGPQRQVFRAACSRGPGGRHGASARRGLGPAAGGRLFLPRRVAAGVGRQGRVAAPRPAAQQQRLAFRVDEVGRLLYIVYLPDKEKAEETLELDVGRAGS